MADGPSRRAVLGGLAATAATPTHAGSAAPEAVAAVNGVVTFRASDFAADETGLLRAATAFPPHRPRRRLAEAKRHADSAGTLLASLLRRGAAGNHGDLYDNRDRNHSTLRMERHPRLTFAEYAEDARAQGLDYGPNRRILFDAITFGNSSTALTGRRVWRSQPRALLTMGAAPALARLYAANHLYVYPEHRDHDPEHGDLFPAASPHFVVSQGSSGSDRPFLRALADALAALRADTKARLRDAGLIAPTLQMLLRRAIAGNGSEDAYLSGRAHPSALDGGALDIEGMLRAAHALDAGAAPPCVRLRMEAETPADEAVFADGLTERLFDTPDAIARVARGLRGLRRYRLSAAGSTDPNERPLRFEWRVLRGPGVSVRPLTFAGDMAEITAPWTRPYAAPDAAGLTTHRIDVGVFAHNGVAWSAPAFFSVAFPPTERRSYTVEGAPVRIDYAPPETDALYCDPLLFPTRLWADAFDHTEDGRLLGWTRSFRDGRVEAYSAHGLRILSRDGAGRPARAEAVAYPVPAPETTDPIVPTAAGATFRYRYAGAADPIGTPEPD